MKTMPRVLLLLLLAAGTANAQTVDDIEIRIAGYQLTANGAEKEAGVSRSTGPVSIGKQVTSVFWMSGCGAFSVSSVPREFPDHATAGWRIEITPTRIVDHVVTFRLRWVRALDKGAGLKPAGQDIELTLKPGETRPLDSVPVPSTAETPSAAPCATRTASLRISAEFPFFDRRLVSADVWLVERLPNGKEDSQLQSVRGLPYRAMPFYFDSIPGGAERFDIFGRLIADLAEGGIEINLETIRAGADSGSKSGYQSARWFRSTVRVKPDEIIEVALPQVDSASGTLAGRMFSLRIRAKQIR